jgi:hypothetical protein
MSRTTFGVVKGHSINGVIGEMKAGPGSIEKGTYGVQVWRSVARRVSGYGPGGLMTVEVRLDDECKNGRNSFAVTAEITNDASRRRNGVQACGCLHKEIAKFFS